MMWVGLVVFFFQGEDGIRDDLVTGVQTCALPILVTYLIALIVGCYAAAWLAGTTRSFDGALHGVVTWAMGLAVSLFLLTSAIGGLIGGALSIVGNTLQTAAPAAAAAAPAAPRPNPPPPPLLPSS